MSALLVLLAAGAEGGGPAASCATAEHRQLEFWAGDWDAYDVDAPQTPAARVRVEKVLDGCALRET